MKNLFKRLSLFVLSLLFIFGLNFFIAGNGSFINKVDLFKATKVLFYIANAEEEKPSKAYFLNDRGQINESIFTEEDILWPGRKIVKDFYIVNNNEFIFNIKNFKTNGSITLNNNKNLASNNSAYEDFVDNVNVKLYMENKEIFNGNAEEFLNMEIINDKIIVMAKDKMKFSMNISMSENASNESMGISYMFKILANINDEDTSASSLVKTGSMINTKILTITGATFIILGFIIFLNKKLD